MNKFDKLPDDVKTKLLFNQWIMYINQDLNDPGSYLYHHADRYYNSYREFRFNSVDLICEYNLLYSDIPKINEVNQNDIFKMCRSKLNLKELKDAR